MKKHIITLLLTLIILLISAGSCTMERQLTGKETVAKQQKDLMFKGYKKRK
jgi:hypothetical protein